MEGGREGGREGVRRVRVIWSEGKLEKEGYGEIERRNRRREGGSGEGGRNPREGKKKDRDEGQEGHFAVLSRTYVRQYPFELQKPLKRDRNKVKFPSWLDKISDPQKTGKKTTKIFCTCTSQTIRNNTGVCIILATLKRLSYFHICLGLH